MTVTREKKTIRSARITDSVWKKAVAEAERNDVSMSHVINELIEGYALGHYVLPTLHKVFQAPAPESKSE